MTLLRILLVVGIVAMASGSDAAEGIAKARASVERGIELAQRGRLEAALALFSQALPEYERETEPFETSILLRRIGGIYMQKGDYARARDAHERAIAIQEKARGPDDLEVALSLVELSDVFYFARDYASAEPPARRALRIAEAARNDVMVARALGPLAEVRRRRGALDEALALAERALKIRERIHGPNDRLVAVSLNGLANVRMDQQRYEEAERLLTRALAIVEALHKGDHPDLIVPLNGLGTLHEARGDMDRAVERRGRATELSEQLLARGLTSGSEQQKQAMLATLSRETNAAVSLHLRSAPAHRGAARLALTTVLRRKGRVIDAMKAAQSAPLRELHARLATAFMRGAGDAELGRLRIEVEELESTLAAPREIDQSLRATTIEDVQRLLGDAALVELVAYEPFNPRARGDHERWGARRYGAYVLMPRGDPLAMDLGDVAAIDEAVARLRKALSTPGDLSAHALGRELDQLVMDPIRKHLGATHDIYLAPDAALNLLPFAALVDARGRYLLESYTFTYLTSGRDLTHLQKLAEPREGAVLISAPGFGSDNRRLHFPGLPGTAKEAADIAEIVAGARLLSGRAARESTVKQLRGPQLLHVATHGFYLPSSDSGVLAQPMLRSGLALAGANDAPTASEDGLLTALEVADLDLRGTRLVVLSACETAVGEARAGDGVHGLRRALALAGAQTQLMSLWKVDDAATTDLMVSYYRALQRGRGRSAALRDVQLAMLAHRKTSHPYYWASFILSGDPRPMPMPAPPKPHASVRPHATRGCACQSAHTASADGSFLLAALAMMLRRTNRRPM